MFVVRIIVDQDRIDYKAFEHLERARDRYEQAWGQTEGGEFDSTAIFDVDATDPRSAIEAVKDGKREMVRLVDFHEAADIRIARIAQNLEFKI